MNFTINTSVLLNNLNYLSRAISTRTPMPVLTGILIELSEDLLVLTASNSDISIKTEIKDESLKVIETGKEVVSGKYLVDIIKKLDEERVNIYVFDNEVRVTTNETSFNFNSLNKEDYPNINFKLVEDPIVLTSDNLKDIIKTTNFCASSVDSRAILQGVCLTISSDELDAIATDSYRLSSKKIAVNLNNVNSKIIIPYQTLNELYKMIPTYNLDIALHINNNSIVFQFEDILFESRLLEGNYPEVSRIIPDTFLLEVAFNRYELIKAVDRSTLFSTSAKDNIIVLSINNNKVEIGNYSKEKGSIVEEIKALNDISKKEFSITFSSKYLLDALDTFTDDVVTLHFTNQYRQFTITSESDVKQVQLILPVRAD